MPKHSVKCELGYARSSLKYWQRELVLRRKARKPRADTIRRAERNVCGALVRVAYWQDLLVAEQQSLRQQLDFWRAFIVPTEFCAEAAAS